MSIRSSLPTLVSVALWMSTYYQTTTAFPTSVLSSTNNTGSLFTSSLVDYIQIQVDTKVLPGVQVAILHPDDSVEYGAWGIRTEDGVNMTTDTLSNVGSVSKAFTASAISILIDDFANGRNSTPLPSTIQKLDWTTKLADLFPGTWQLQDEWATEKANLNDLLSHMTGMPRNDWSYGGNDTTQDILERQKIFRPAFELRENFVYNNQMYMIASLIVQTYTNSTMADFVQSRIFAPLNMASTTYSVDTANATGKFTQLWNSEARRIPYWVQGSSAELVDAGPGGVITSAEDLIKWARLWVNQGVNPDTNETVVPDYAQMTTSRAIMAGNTTTYGTSTSIAGYGLGWMRWSYLGHDVVYHDGDMPGVNTIVGFLPSDGLGFAVLINSDITADQPISIADQIIASYIASISSSSTSTSDLSARDLFAFEDIPVLPRSASRQRSILRRAAASSSTTTSVDLTGTYYNAGYGNITFCSAAFSNDASCNPLLSDFAAVDAVSGTGFNASSVQGGELVADWGKFFAPQARLIPSGAAATDASGNTTAPYTIIVEALFPQGYGANTAAFEELLGSATATFVVDGTGSTVYGFGLTGTVGEESDRQLQGGSVEETADVWFVKL